MSGPDTMASDGIGLGEGRAARFAAATRHGWAVLRRHRVILFVTMALCLLAGALIILMSTPDYRATASVEVQDVPAGAAGSNAQAATHGAPGDIESLMQTELEVLRSRALAEEVARDLALVGTPTFFAGMDRKRPTEGAGSLTQRQVEQDMVVRLLRDNLEVDLPGKSRVLRISFVSADPVLSARVANSYADSLIRADLKRGFESGVQARRFLLGELDGARKDLARAERDLAVYAARTSGATDDGDDTQRPPQGTIAARLAQLNAYRAQALADRIAAQKRWEGARRASPETLPEVLGNGAMQSLMTRNGSSARMPIPTCARRAPVWRRWTIRRRRWPTPFARRCANNMRLRCMAKPRLRRKSLIWSGRRRPNAGATCRRAYWSGLSIPTGCCTTACSSAIATWRRRRDFRPVASSRSIAQPCRPGRFRPASA